MFRLPRTIYFIISIVKIIHKKSAADGCISCIKTRRRLSYYNITRLTKINFCIAFAICSLLNANNSRSLKYGVKKSLQANFFTYIIKVLRFRELFQSGDKKIVIAFHLFVKLVRTRKSAGAQNFGEFRRRFT